MRRNYFGDFYYETSLVMYLTSQLLCYIPQIYIMEPSNFFINSLSYFSPTIYKYADSTNHIEKLVSHKILMLLILLKYFTIRKID